MPPKSRYPTPLAFDYSKSAIVRFFGEPVVVNVHFDQSLEAPQVLMACPESVGGKTEDCLACSETGEPALRRLACTGWDMWKERWCVYLASPGVFGGIRSKVPDEFMEGFVRGMGPSVILQREGRQTSVEVAIETVGKKCPGGSPPPMEEYIRGMFGRSAWLRKV